MTEHEQRETLVAGLAGVGLGVVARIADNQENALTWLGSLMAPWALLAFVLGARQAGWRPAMALATTALVAGVVAYYGWWYLIDGGARLGGLFGFWLLLAPVAGVVFGLAGWLWSARPGHWLVPVAAIAFAGGVVAGESAFMAVTARSLERSEIALLLGTITLGLLLPLVLLPAARDRLAGIALTACFLAAGVATVPMARWLVEVIR